MTVINLKSKNTIKALFVIAALSFFAVSCLKQNADKAEVAITAKDRDVSAAPAVLVKNYGTFLHSVPEHDEINCDSCHKRESSSNKLEFPVHDSCISCHLSEFTNTGSGICAMCHDELKSMPATMKPFPVRFNEQFNMKFDHAAHMKGDAAPPEGCAACHQPQGAAKTIPSGIGSHTTCFVCHTAESEIGSCSFCHESAPYQRTIATRTIFKAAFSHADHTFRQGISCADCHSVKAGAPQSKQVISPVGVQHFSAPAAVSCRTCHNDKRAFGEQDFANCKRCHDGPGFDMFP